MLELLSYPFMLRALLAGVFVALLLGALGPFVVSRRLSFIGDGIAHASLAGIALALLLGWAPIPTAALLSALIAAGIYALEKKSAVSGDAAIAVMFTTGLAVGIVLLSFYQGYQPELISYLFGNILTINAADLANIAVFGLAVLIGLAALYRRILFAAFDPAGAYLSGLSPWIYDLFLYVAVAVSVVLSIKLAGIILVSALLVTPSATAKLFARSFRSFVGLSLALAVSAVLAGLILSYYLDLPSGAVIILAATLIFIAGLAAHAAKDRWRKVR